MVRCRLLSVVLITCVAGPTVRSQDSDEVKRLKERNELLETKLKLAEKENELLKKEIEQLKAKQPSPGKDAAKQTLSDLLQEGKVFTGDYRYTNGGMTTGEFVMTVTKRDGKTIKCTSVSKSNVKDSVPVEWSLDGEINGVQLALKTTGTVTKITMSLSLKGESLDGEFSHPHGVAKGKVAFKLSK